MTPITALITSLRIFSTPTVRLDISSFAFPIRSVRSQVSSISVPSLSPVLISVLVVDSSSSILLNSDTRSFSCFGSVITRLRTLEYSSGISRLHNVTMITNSKTSAARIPTARDIFSACSGFFILFWSTGTRY